MVARSAKDERSPPLSKANWLAFPAALHVASTFVVFLVGRLGFLPANFDAKGIGISFASDSTRYDSEAIELVKTLTHDGIGAWLMAAPQLHVKIYSLSYAALGPLLGFNIIAAEPINLLYYLTTVYLVFAIGQKLFNRRSGLLSALIVALWPSLLLHSTQLLRDPLLIVAWLILILIISEWLTTVLPWRRGLVSGLLAVSVSLTLWNIRMGIWTLLRASVVLLSVLLIVRQLRNRQFQLGNWLALVCLLIVVMILPQISHAFQRPNDFDGAARAVDNRLAAPRLIMARRQFAIDKDGGEANSSIDREVVFSSSADIVRYLPRAIQIGFLAPFPNTWLQKGTGSARLLLAGLETLAMYVIELLACLTLWRQRRQLSVWLLCLIASLGMLGLPLVVFNVGTLYRLRYPFLILLIIVASESLTNLTSLKTLKRRSPEGTASPA